MVTYYEPGTDNGPNRNVLFTNKKPAIKLALVETACILGVHVVGVTRMQTQHTYKITKDTIWYQVFVSEGKNHAKTMGVLYSAPNKPAAGGADTYRLTLINSLLVFVGVTKLTLFMVMDSYNGSVHRKSEGIIQTTKPPPHKRNRLRVVQDVGKCTWTSVDDVDNGSETRKLWFT